MQEIISNRRNSFLVVVCHQFIEQPHTPARTPALIDSGFFGVHGGACHIKMRPWHFVDEALQKLGCGDGARETAADVFHIGDV